ncbi:hypothetical protein GGR56DRAFT_311626 [Xylariaceae sp. FL0804]|nr:hypothetical protein GGR56DRAFT_311626 [Xylariaceae sp. FL0804]
MGSYEARRLENIKHNESLVSGLGLRDGLTFPAAGPGAKANTQKKSASKRHRVTEPARRSARIATSAASRPVHPDVDDDDDDDEDDDDHEEGEEFEPEEDGDERPKRPRRKRKKTTATTTMTSTPAAAAHPDDDDAVAALMARWTAWTPAAPPPTRDAEGTYHFASHPDFQPNKSPEAVLREGAFGGAYWRPLRPAAPPFRRRVEVRDDWRADLPAEWTAGLDVDRYVSGAAAAASGLEGGDPAAVNKFGVACGQSIEQWEAAGWINHDFDVRGWFQWYVRFWRGRRCEDDDRQVGRWRRCVGETGRWRRTLLKKYVQRGIRTVTDEGDELGDERPDVSPVVHQTCHHWAWEVRQEALDRFWAEQR